MENGSIHINGYNAGGRVLYFDILNILAAFSVVWIHFGNEVHWYDGSQVWYWCAGIQAVAYWAVPIFFMLSGATLMTYRDKYDTWIFMKRRVFRGIFPYLVWGTLLALLGIGGGKIQNPLQVGVARGFMSVLDIFMYNRMEDIYWFFPAIFGIYLSMPVLSIFARPEYRKILNYMVVVGVLTISVLPFGYVFLQSILQIEVTGWNSSISLQVLGGWLLYPVLGYWASTHDFSAREEAGVYILAVLSLVFRYSGMIYLCVRDGTTNHTFFNYLSFPALFLALGVFVFVKQTVRWHDMFLSRWSGWFRTISSASLGVYLIHNIVMRWMAGMPFFAKYSFRWYFIWPLPCYVACVLLVLGVRRLPFGKYLFP